MIIEIILLVAAMIYLVVDWWSYRILKLKLDFYQSLCFYNSIFLEKKFPEEYLKAPKK